MYSKHKSKLSIYWVFSSPCFPELGLNTRKYGPEKNFVFGHISRSVKKSDLIKHIYENVFGQKSNFNVFRLGYTESLLLLML